MADAEFQPLPPYDPADDLQQYMGDVQRQMMESLSYNWPKLVGTPKEEPNELFEIWERSRGKDR